jgi:hypothetical protein
MIGMDGHAGVEENRPMRHVLTIVAAVLAGVAVGQSLLAAPPARPVNPASPASAAELKVWLDQLDDECYALREQATERLHAAGERAIDVLAQGALSGSPEAAWRAGEALKRIAITGDERTIDRVADALERVGKQGRLGMAQVVADIRARQKQLRHDRAAMQIRRLGGGLSGGMTGMEAGMVMVDVGFLPVPVVDEVEVVKVEEPTIEVAALEDAPAKVVPADLVPVEVAPPKELDEPLPAAPAADLAEAVKELFEGELSLERKGGRAIEEEAIDEHAIDADDVDDFRRLERLPLGAEEPAEEEAPVAVADLDLGIDVFAAPAGAIFIGGGFAEIEVEEGMRSESLALDANWRGGDKGLEALRDLPEVTSISIQGAKLTDAGLKHIAALPKLSSISIRGTVFSVAALRELHKARPSAYLFCQGEAMVGIHADTTGSCVLTSVYGGSGAADAGLREGDKILAIDGVEIRDFSELTISVYGHGVGEKLKIEYERDGKRQTAQIELKPRSVLEP